MSHNLFSITPSSKIEQELESLENFIKSEKSRCLQLNRAGQKDAAKVLYHQVREMEAKAQLLKNKLSQPSTPTSTNTTSTNTTSTNTTDPTRTNTPLIPPIIDLTTSLTSSGNNFPASPPLSHKTINMSPISSNIHISVGNDHFGLSKIDTVNPPKLATIPFDVQSYTNNIENGVLLNNNQRVSSPLSLSSSGILNNLTQNMGNSTGISSWILPSPTSTNLPLKVSSNAILPATVMIPGSSNQNNRITPEILGSTSGERSNGLVSSGIMIDQHHPPISNGSSGGGSQTATTTENNTHSTPISSGDGIPWNILSSNELISSSGSETTSPLASNISRSAIFMSNQNHNHNHTINTISSSLEVLSSNNYHNPVLSESKSSDIALEHQTQNNNRSNNTLYHALITERIQRSKDIAKYHRDHGDVKYALSVLRVMKNLEVILQRLEQNNNVNISMEELPDIPEPPKIIPNMENKTTPTNTNKLTESDNNVEKKEFLNSNKSQDSNNPEEEDDDNELDSVFQEALSMNLTDEKLSEDEEEDELAEDPETELKRQQTPKSIAGNHTRLDKSNHQNSPKLPHKQQQLSQLYETSMPEKIDPATRTMVIETLITILEKQLGRSHELAVKARKASDAEQTKLYLNRKKQYQKDLQKIQEIKLHPEVPPPLYHFDEVKSEVEVVNSELGLHDLLLQFSSVSHILPPSGLSELSVYFECEIPYPDSQNPQVWKTPTFTCPAPRFCADLNFKQLFRIERKQTLSRFIRTRKISITLWHSRFLLGDICLGRCEVRLNELAVKSAIEVKSEVMDGRKSTGASLFVSIRLRTPVEVKETKTIKEKILIIDKHFTQEDLLMRKIEKHATPSPTSTRRSDLMNPQFTELNSATAAAAAGRNNNNLKSTSAEAQRQLLQYAKVKPAVKNQQYTDPAQLKMKTESIDWIISSAVLEQEHLKLTERIETLEENQSDHTTEVKRLLKISKKITEITHKIQSGNISLESYFHEISKKIQEEKKVAGVLAKAGYSAEAEECLERMRIMESELSKEI